MEKFELIAPCHFGMEAVLKREILDLGYEITKVEDKNSIFITVYFPLHPLVQPPSLHCQQTHS